MHHRLSPEMTCTLGSHLSDIQLRDEEADPFRRQEQIPTRTHASSLVARVLTTALCCRLGNAWAREPY